MKMHLWALVSVLLSALLLFAPGCENAEDSDGADDDETDDDDTGDDDDDTGDDDDDTGDDDDDTDDDDDDTDDDDDDDTDYSTEPLAVIECLETCAEVGQELNFSGAGSSDPGNGALTYRFDFGDGEFSSDVEPAHAYNQAGAYRVTLTVENPQGQSDASSCIVSVGDIPTSGDRFLDDLDMQTNYVDPTIIEAHNPGNDGGRFYGFFISPVDAIPDTLVINGETYSPDNPPANLMWCEVVPTELVAGQPGIVRCHSNHSDYDPGESVTIEVREGETTIWQATRTLENPKLRLNHITTTRNGTELLVYTRNETQESIEVTGLAIDGLDVTGFTVIDNPILDPGRTATLRMPLCNGFNGYHQWRIFTVIGSDGLENIRETRALRLFEPKFFIGDWNGSSQDVFHDPENALVPLLEAGIDTFKWESVSDVSPEEAFALAEQYDFYIWTHDGELSPEKIQVIQDWGDNPRWVLNAVKGEGDSEDPTIALAKLEQHRDVWPHQRLWIYNNLMYYFPIWTGMADFTGMDHYCVWAAQSNLNWPPGYWDQVYNLGKYAEAYRLNSEPAPTWYWTQSIWNTFDISGTQVRCTTADEIRSQWYEILGHGAKSIFWFYLRPEWIRDCQDPEAVEEHRKLATELRAVEDIVLEGHTTTPDNQYVNTTDEDIEVRTVTSPYGMIVVMVNMDYDLNLIAPYYWHGKSDVLLTLVPPAGFEPASFTLIKSGETAELLWKKIAPRTWQFVVPSVDVAEMVLITPEP